MKNYTCFICCVLLCFLSSHLYAQGENNNWCFGKNKCLSFNTNPPTLLTDSMQVIEGSSSVSDAAGNLLFYTSGANVWDRNHNHMPNGIDMAGNGPSGPVVGQNYGSSSQGVVIVQSPANNNQYYIFTTDAREDNIYNGYYSVVDMTLNGGLGDVVPGQKSIIFATDIGEGVIAGRASGCTGYWIIVHKLYGPDYLSFNIDANGVAAVPVISPGIIGANDNLQHFGGMCLNPVGDRLVRCSSQTETASFDNISGVLSGFVLMDTVFSGYYPLFSPAGSKLYANGNNICQYDMSLLPDAIAVQNSRTLIDTGLWQGMRADPGGRIYAVNLFSGYLGRIDNPDNAGLACGFVPNAIAFFPPVGTICSELGSDVLLNAPADTLIHVLDTTICFLPTITLSTDPSRPNRQWSTGSTGVQETFTQSGTYWVYSLKNCSAYIDTFHLHFTGFEVSLGRDTSLCAGGSLLLDATTENAGYVWQDGTTGPTYTVDAEGVYVVSVSQGPCTLSDTVVVDIIHPSLDIPEQDSTICKGDPVTLHALSTPEGNYLWNTGSTATSIVINGAGTYTVSATTVCGILNDSVRIEEEDCNCDAFVPNAFSPNGDGKNDILEVRLHCPQLSTYNFTIYNRYGQRVYQSAWPGQGWDGYHNGAPADMGTYFFYLRYKDNAGKETIKRGDIILLR